MNNFKISAKLRFLKLQLKLLLSIINKIEIETETETKISGLFFFLFCFIMAVPKKKRSLTKCKKRRNTIFFDKLVGNWLKRREWFFRHAYQKAILPIEHEPEPFKFPGFWPNKFVCEISSKLKKIVK